MIEISSGDYIVHVTGDLECITERELIRCKDCKHWFEHKQGGVGECFIKRRYDHRAYVTEDDDFCSMAERVRSEINDTET